MQGLNQTPELLGDYDNSSQTGLNNREIYYITQKDVQKEGRLQDYWFHGSKIHSDLGFIGFSLCYQWYQLYPEAGSPHGHMMDANSNCYSMLLGLFPVGWDRLNFYSQKPQASFSLHLAGLSWLSSAHLWTKPWQEEWNHLVWLRLIIWGRMNVGKSSSSPPKCHYTLKSPTYKYISQASIRATKLLWVAQNKGFIIEIRSYSIVGAGEAVCVGCRLCVSCWPRSHHRSDRWAIGKKSWCPST